MTPTYNDGDWLVVRYIKAKRALKDGVYNPGDAVVIYRKLAPTADASYLIKRVKGISQDGLFVVGDNPSASTDSRTWGPIPANEVIGKVVFRYRKGK